MPISRIKTDGIQDDAITSAKIGDTNIQSADIADGSVITAKIAAGAVTSAKLDTNIDIAGTLDVTGATTLDSTLAVVGNSTANSMNLGGRGFLSGGAQLGVNFTSASAAGLQINDTNSGNLGGMLQFYSGSGGGTLRANIQNANNTGVHMCLGTGGTVVFGNTGYTAANALDDYEEGTWTPAFSFTNSNGGHTTSNAAGHYLKVGDFAYIQGYIALAAKNSASGDCRIGMGSLPFTPRSTANYIYFGVYVNNGQGDFTGANQMFGQLQANDATLRIYASQGGGNVDQLNDVDVKNGTDFRFAGWIPVN